MDDDEFTSYEQGMSYFIEFLASNKDQQSAHLEALDQQARLLRNIDQTRRFGSEPALTVDLNKIINCLNSLCLATSRKSFNEWCGIKHSSLDLLSARPLLAVSPTMQKCIRKLFSSLQNTLEFFEQEGDFYQFECEDIRKLLQKDYVRLSVDMIAQIVPIDISQASLIVALYHIKQNVEEIIGFIREFEPVCQKSSGRKRRQEIQEKLSNIISYMLQSILSLLIG